MRLVEVLLPDQQNRSIGRTGWPSRLPVGPCIMVDMLTCANCGEQNPERARFCLNCGASLASEQRRGARKVVTVVVCDVTGSTALGERLDIGQ